MHIRASLFWSPKTGNTLDEYEDAYYPLRMGDFGGKKLRFAVADGASEGMLSRHWANVLVRSFCRADLTAMRFPDFLAHTHQQWQAWYEEYLAYRRQHKPIQWFEEPGLEKGAFSTLLGLELLERRDGGKWRAVGFGDSCLFQVRGQKLLHAFPISDPAGFDSRPLLLASNPAYNQQVGKQVQTLSGNWKAGDCFYLLTDAIAHWFLDKARAGKQPWQQFVDLGTPAFAAWVDDLKSAKMIRNDDITLLELKVF
jgi:hypothetical protein